MFKARWGCSWIVSNIRRRAKSSSSMARPVYGGVEERLSNASISLADATEGSESAGMAGILWGRPTCRPSEVLEDREH
jgi:hypothetical protein